MGKWCILRQCHCHGDLCTVHIRHEGSSLCKGCRCTSNQQYEHKQKYHRLCLKCKCQYLFISFNQTAKEPSILFWSYFGKYTGCHSRHYGQSHDQTGKQGICNGQSHIHKELSGNSFSKYNRKEYTYGCQRGCKNRTCHLPGTLNSCLFG